MTRFWRFFSWAAAIAIKRWQKRSATMLDSQPASQDVNVTRNRQEFSSVFRPTVAFEMNKA
jgi:hypothetical protein